MDTHKSRSVPIQQGCHAAANFHGMAPAQDDTHNRFVWLKKRRPAAAFGFFPCLGFAGYEPKLSAWAYSVKELLVPWTEGAGNVVKLVKQQTSGWTAS